MKILALLIVLVYSLSSYAEDGVEKVSAAGFEATCFQGKSRALYSLLERLIAAVTAECEAKGANSMYQSVNEKFKVNLTPHLKSEYCGGVSAELKGDCLVGK